MIWRSCFRLSQWLHKVAVFHYPLKIESGRFSLMFVAKKVASDLGDGGDP